MENNEIKRESVADRLFIYLDYKGITTHKAETDMDMSNGTLKKSAQPGRKLSEKCLEKVEKFYTDLNMDWLRTGHGNMISDAVTQSGDNTNVNNSNINSHHCNDSQSFVKALDEIAAQRRFAETTISRMQDEIDRLLTIIEKK